MLILLHISSSFLADPGEARGCSTVTSVTDWLIHSLTHPLVKISLRRRHVLLVEDVASGQKIDYITVVLDILNPAGYPNGITGSKVTAILLNGWVLPVGAVALGRVCAQPAKQACFHIAAGLMSTFVECPTFYSPVSLYVTFCGECNFSSLSFFIKFCLVCSFNLPSAPWRFAFPSLRIS